MRAGQPGLREGIVAAVLCMAGAALVFAEPLFGGASTLSFDPRHPMYPAPWAQPASERPPINPITSDIDFFVLPGLMRQRQLAAASHPPWWDPNCLLGYPLGANMPFPVFLPTAFLVRGLDPVSSLDLLTAFHTALAGWLAWRAARLLGASSGAGAVAAAGFALSTWMTTRWHLPQIAWTTSAFPGLVAAVARAGRGARVGAAAEAALWVLLLCCSGFPQVGLILVGTGGLLAVLEPASRRPAALASLALGVALGLMLSAPQLAAVRSVYGDSARAQPEARSQAALHGLTPAALIGGIVPEFFGLPPDFAAEDPPAPTFDAWLPQRLMLSGDIQDNPVENALYPGVLLLLLAAVALGRAGPRARTLVLLPLVAVLGAVLYPWVVRLVPALDVLAGASIKRVLVLVAGCLPLAGALALDALREGRAGLPWRTGTGLAVVLGGLALLPRLVDDPAAERWAALLDPALAIQLGLLVVGLGLLALTRRAPVLASVLVVLVLGADLTGRAWAFNPFPPQVEPFPPTESTRWLAERPGRVALFGDPLALPGSLATLHGIETLQGIGPMLDARVAQLLACIEGPLADPRDPRFVGPLRADASLDHPLLDLFGVATVVHRDPGLAARLGRPNAYENVAEGLAALTRDGHGPRAFLATGAAVLASPSERLARLARRDFDPHATVLLEVDPGLDLPTRGPWQPVEVTSSSPDRVELSVDAAGPGLVCIAMSWHGGWRAELDGEAAEVLRAHHALMAVSVGAGQHTVVLQYEAPGGRSVRRVARVAGVVWVLLALGVLVAARRGRRSSPAV